MTDCRGVTHCTKYNIVLYQACVWYRISRIFFFCSIFFSIFTFKNTIMRWWMITISNVKSTIYRFFYFLLWPNLSVCFVTQHTKHVTMWRMLKCRLPVVNTVSFRPDRPIRFGSVYTRPDLTPYSPQSGRFRTPSQSNIAIVWLMTRAGFRGNARCMTCMLSGSQMLPWRVSLTLQFFFIHTLPCAHTHTHTHTQTHRRLHCGQSTPWLLNNTMRP